MSELKTRRTKASVAKFFSSIADDTRRADARTLSKLIGRITGEKPAMWGSAIVGFGHRKWVYPDGRENDWMLIAFSPRKAANVIYIDKRAVQQGDILKKLGKHTLSGGCLHIKSLGDVDLKVLEALLRSSVLHAKKS